VKQCGKCSPNRQQQNSNDSIKAMMSNKIPLEGISKEGYTEWRKKRLDTDTRRVLENKEEQKRLCHFMTTLMDM
jgi:hypothetical protein